MSNTFVTPRVVTTISQSRIDYNESVTSLLQNFASAGEPDPLDISLEGSTGLRTGMFWYKSGTDTTDGQGRFLVYDGTSFTRNGIGTYQMSNGTEADTAAAAGIIEYGDLILIGTDDLYMVNSAGSAIKKIGGDASTLSGLVSTQFLRSDESDSMTGSLTVSGDLTVDTNTLYVNSTTNRVGIGTSSPEDPLTLAGGGRIGTTTTTSAYGQLSFGRSGASTGSHIIGDTSGNIRFVNGTAVAGTSTERMRIDSSGNVGIGTSTPQSELDVFGVSDIIRSTANDGSPNFMAFYDATGRKGYLGYGGVTEDMTLFNERSGFLRFGTNGSARMQITSAGNVGIGTSSPSEKLHVVGNVLVTGDVNSLSDEALKENIATLEDSLDSVKKLRGVSYTWKENGKESIGLIAQEVEQIEPKLVSEQDGLKSVKYGNVVAILIEAVKELSAKVEELESKLDGR